MMHQLFTDIVIWYQSGNHHKIIKQELQQGSNTRLDFEDYLP